MSLARRGAPDLGDARNRIVSGASSAASMLEESFAAAGSEACRGAFVRRFDATARAAAAAVDLQRAGGAPLPPLAGLAVSVKDLFEVAGQPTTAASAALTDAEPATADCPAVARLRAAGAALVGHTNLSEFAFSGLGLNPHHGTPANPVTAALDSTPRVPGGSTSGGAVSVATGAAWAALGSDTGGSIRIPAAFQGLVGFKSTQALVPLDGCIPLSPTLDTACAITRSVADAVLVHGILAAREVRPAPRPLAGLRLALPRTLMLDSLDDTVARAFETALATLAAGGARIVEIALPELAELAVLNAAGGFPAAESWAWHRRLLADRGKRYDPRVAARIRRGETMAAADYLDLQRARRDWIARVTAALAGFDAALSPTVPIVAPPLAPLVADDTQFFATNGLVLRNPAVVNFLDGCALSLPCQREGTLPVGLMLWAPALADDSVLGAALEIERALAAREV
ncbi:amidase [Rubrivivax gelatinosus]|uniref:Amidase n=1 Tax=Rubrivivax gelatinosus TaxID=28068 RepID=A0ABS1DS74_RUBGE|nr:amidase [Rubrivivax gelatinosus]MBK1712556.1 amidase [Rubrivivax gelatinosus]